jgi:hypothetical protein
MKLLDLDSISEDVSENQIPLVISGDDTDTDTDTVEESSSITQPSSKLAPIPKMKQEFNDIRQIVVATLMRKATLLGYQPTQENAHMLNQIVDSALASHMEFFVLEKLGITTLQDVFDEKFLGELIEAIQIAPAIQK